MKNKKIQMAKSTGYSLLSIIGILTLILFISSCSSVKKTMSNDTMSNDIMGIRENNSTVADFVAYVDANNTMVPDHSYINNALVKLADATNAMAGEINYIITPNLDMAKDYANKITQDANETTHAANIRKSAEILSSALQNMQRSKYPGLSSSATILKGNADAIKTNVLVHHQKEAIATFLKNSASLLQQMN